MGQRIKQMKFPDRLAMYTDKPDECWPWPGAVDPKSGYVPIKRGDGSRTHAHKYAYELTIGPVPDGLVVDHLCRVRHCINARHMEAVPQSVNIRRGLLGGRTHCNYGHPLSGDNIKPSKEGWRACRTCANDKLRAARKADPTRFRLYTQSRDRAKVRARDKARWTGERRDRANAARKVRWHAQKAREAQKAG